MGRFATKPAESQNSDLAGECSESRDDRFMPCRPASDLLHRPASYTPSVASPDSERCRRVEMCLFFGGEGRRLAPNPLPVRPRTSQALQHAWACRLLALTDLLYRPRCPATKPPVVLTSYLILSHLILSWFTSFRINCIRTASPFGAPSRPLGSRPAVTTLRFGGGLAIRQVGPAAWAFLRRPSPLVWLSRALLRTPRVVLGASQTRGRAPRPTLVASQPRGFPNLTGLGLVADADERAEDKL
ncbi:hypothetical protein RHS01_10259 [Rhizoctonia solani]|uniref:Uncharacterized protein n=1 Tax=Rhizoctonia solani TaxID=456999 RepID=A0A8H7I7I4_9AGAM|nr:hypothetical protein RHS01_10259 [Rhizoctonia solani]